MRNHALDAAGLTAHAVTMLAWPWGCNAGRFDDDGASMRRSYHRAALTEALLQAIARFHADVRQLARTVLRHELARILATLEPTLASAPEDAGTRKQPAATRRTRKPAVVERTRAEQAVAEPAVATAAVAEASIEAAEPSAPVAAATASGPPRQAGARKRTQWTRETIVDELATWLLSGTAIDAAFMTRHGPRGLVTATRRVFGRFDAALNIAGLHLSKLYPDGPPEDHTARARARQ